MFMIAGVFAMNAQWSTSPTLTAPPQGCYYETEDSFSWGWSQGLLGLMVTETTYLVCGSNRTVASISFYFVNEDVNEVKEEVERSINLDSKLFIIDPKATRLKLA